MEAKPQKKSWSGDQWHDWFISRHAGCVSVCWIQTPLLKSITV